jgi:probable phosphoglycerate mutase
MPAQPILTLLAIRHGETVSNAAKRYQGHSDSALISSDLGRAQETASIIAKHTGHLVKTDSRLRERNYGILEGLTVPEINSRHAEVLDRLDANDPDYIIPDGESHRQHYQRNIAAIEELESDKSVRRIAMVVHGGVLDSLFRYVARLPLNQPRCFITTNASLTIITQGIFYNTMRWVIETWCDTAHLEGIGQRFGLG